MRDYEFWKSISDAMDVGKPVCLIIMVAADGDGPNRPGAKMAVMPDQRIGTIGGGAAEKMLTDKALDMLTMTSPKAKLFDLSHSHDNTENQSGMICSGNQTFALYPVSRSDQSVLQQICAALSQNTSATIQIKADGLALSAPANKPFHSFDPEQWSYQESINIETATLIGGGHVSFALTPLLSSLGMRVIVLDNRHNLDTMQKNSSAHEKLVVDYQNILPHIPTGPHSYVCIMTFAHAHDETVLGQLINLELKYLGMMGSIHKIKTIFSHLRQKKVTQSKLDKVHAPIGLNIGSNTPEEIAISIAAEIIAVRQGMIQ